MPYRDPEKHRAASRESMRRFRAKLPKPPKPLPEPSKWDLLTMVQDLKQPEQSDWVQAVHSDIAAAGLALDDAQALDVWKLYQPHRAEARRAERKAKEAARAAKREEEAREKAERAIKRCTFCWKAQSEVALMWGADRFPLICNECVAKAAKDMQAAKRTASNDAVEKRTGKHGKKRKQQKR